MSVEFRLLGAVEASVGGRSVDLGSARQRCVLVALLVEVDHVVLIDQLVDRVWGEHRPRSARATLYSYMSRLRRALAGAADIVQQSGGYRLTVDESAVDVHRFGRLVAEARAIARAIDHDEQALALYEQALRLWRGEPFAGLDTPWLATIRAALEQERSVVALDHVDVALRCGRHAALLPALATRVQENPWDERVVGQLMLALYRGGRQADALDCYRQTRLRLAQELGTDPSPPLQQLHHQVLTCDPALFRATAAAANGGPAARPRFVGSDAVVGRGQEPVHNLPVELTRFVGRGEELGEIEQLVRGRRLVTLAGVGGCGKTRLAVELGARLLERWPDGVWLIDLGPVTDPAQVARLTASTLGVLVKPSEDPVQALASQLRNRRMLLCLDTCEHLLDAAAALTETVLRSCLDVSILATSREPLGVAGETVWRVPSLKENEAVALFADRASLVDPQFDVDVTQADVRAACSRVDNIPLAIELAAAWVRALSPAQIAAGLDDRLRVLVGKPGRTIRRHQTMQASMAWSHALLDDDERIMFRRLAVFSGDFALEAVDAVCGSVDPLTLVGRLVDKSLVSVRHGQDQVGYRLLDSIRHYARQQLRASGETETTQDRHLDYYLAQAEAAQAGLETAQDTWRHTLESLHDNITTALQWALSAPGDRASDKGASGERASGERAGRGRRLAAAMARQWFIRGQAHTGLEFLRRAIDLEPADRSVLQGRLITGTAMLGMVSGQSALVAQMVDRGLRLAAQTGDEVTRARCLAMTAAGSFFVDFEQCQAMARQAQQAAIAAGDPFSRDWATVVEAYSLTTRSRHDEATALARLAFRRSWPRGDRFTAAFARDVEVWAALETGNLRGAAAIAEELLQIVKPLGDYFAVGTVISTVALIHGTIGDITAGLTLMEPIVRSLDQTPDVDAVAFEYTMGMLHLWDANLHDAVQWLERGISRMTDDSKNWTATRCLPSMAAAQRRLGRLQEAQQYAAKAVTLAAEYRAPYLLAEALDEQAFLIADTDPDRAHDLHHQAFTLRNDNHLHGYLVKSLDALGRIESTRGNHGEAIRLLTAADTARNTMNYPRPPIEHAEHETLIAELRTNLGTDEFESLWHNQPTKTPQP